MNNDEGKIVQIDENNLDRECIRLPRDYLKYALAAAEARKDVDEAKAQLEVVEADLSKSIRNTPGKYGLEKVTESAIREVVVGQKKFLEAQDALKEAKHNFEIHQAVLSALEHKKRSLTLLVDLHGMGYFSSPRLSKSGREAVEEMTKRKVRRSRNDD